MRKSQLPKMICDLILQLKFGFLFNEYIQLLLLNINNSYYDNLCKFRSPSIFKNILLRDIQLVLNLKCFIRIDILDYAKMYII